VHDHAGELGVDPGRVGVIGGSARGGPAAALTLLCRVAGDPGPPTPCQALPDTRTVGGMDDSLRCSFCGRPSADVSRLIAGPGVYICDGCVAACDTILVDHADDGPAPPPRLPEWRAMSDDEMLAQIPRIAATGAQVEQSLRSWVAELRARSVTWSRIGDALSMTRQSAWERFADA
jgi:ClpX C4-type zinc finger